MTVPAARNGRKIKRDRVERAALDALTKELIAPDMIAEFVRTYNAERVDLVVRAMALRHGVRVPDDRNP